MAGPLCSRPPDPRARCRALRLLYVLALLAGGVAITCAPASAQQLNFPAPGPAHQKSAIERERDKAGAQKQMLVQANEINYDYNNKRVAAVGNVQIYYGGSTLEADKVIYDQTTKRLHAEGKFPLTEVDGKVTYGQIMDLSDDYRDGFVDSLRLDAPDQTRMAAARAERSSGNYTVFHSGVYTACAPCRDDPKKPPLWQVKAARIIHDQNEKMIYFEDARLEFWGHPIAYLPYFSTPDPTVKRKTGFLVPSVASSSNYGLAIDVPYYWALAPDYDVTVEPLITTKQGPLMQAEFRQRLLNGAYEIRGSGIRQLDPGYFNTGAATPGNRDWRGSVESDGQFALTDRWVWGWDGLLVSDQTYLQNYNPHLSRYHITDPFQTVSDAGLSQLYIAGKGNRSYFDARSMYFYGFSAYDVQKQLPVIHPVVDYMYTVDHPVLGGELGFNTNVTSLSRSQAEFDAITQNAFNAGSCANTADPAMRTSANCLLRGIPGNYNRFSAETNWRREITDNIGQQWTPFASLRADVASVQVTNDPSVSNFITPGDTSLVRAMPSVGLEYRYPFISVQSWGTQTFSPIAQVIARPNETQVNKWPNEDAQTLIFDDSNLFRTNKFSGWDRVEGGGRTNYGAEYTMQFNQGGAINMLFGQSYQLFGANSFAQSNLSNTGIDSGLDTRLSDYVTRFSYQPNRTYQFISRFRFDKDDFTVQRMEFEARATFDRWSVSALYGDYAAQPAIGFVDRRQGVLATGSYKLDTNWVLLGGARYDLQANQFDQTRIGLGYVDDCLILAVNYITNYAYSGNPVTDHQIMLQLSLRTLGGTSVSQGVGGLGGL
jgi:LPS-assembly protein